MRLASGILPEEKAMRVPVFTAALAACCALAFGQAPSGVVATMTPELIREAIAFGGSQKNAPCYAIQKRGFVGSLYKPVLGVFTTPFCRVAMAAYEAKRQYKAFSESDVAPEITVPELNVIGMAQANGARVASVQTIVIMPKGQHEISAAIHPSSTREVPVEFRNAMGMKAEGRSLLAVFALDVLQEGAEVHIVYDSGVHNGAENKYCEDCAVDFKLEKVR